jgi:hypothetical protein
MDGRHGREAVGAIFSKELSISLNRQPQMDANSQYKVQSSLQINPFLFSKGRHSSYNLTFKLVCDYYCQSWVVDTQPADISLPFQCALLLDPTFCLLASSSSQIGVPAGH